MTKGFEVKPIYMKMDQIPADDITVTAHLEFTRLFRFRLWLGTRLLLFLSWLWDANIEVVMDEEE